MNYYKPIDSIRAIAVFLIVASHWFDASSLSHQLGVDSIGVNTLFVVSGFLVTRLLLDQREQAMQSGYSISSIALNFYVRRSLRIFPVYYLLVSALLIYHFEKNHVITADFYYYLTYTSNFYFYTKHAFEGLIPHVWSLAVGAQFYLIWPWILLYAKKNHLPGFIAGFILVGVVAQLLFSPFPLGYLLPVTCFDCFGMGALLAWVVIYNPALLHDFYKKVSVAALISVVTYGWFVYQGLWKVTVLRTCTGVVTLWILTYVVSNTNRGRLIDKYILYSPFLKFIGKISYGLFLYHLLIPLLIDNDFFWLTINVNLPDSMLRHLEWVYFGEAVFLLFVASILSYYIIEKPFLTLNKRVHFSRGHSVR